MNGASQQPMPCNTSVGYIKSWYLHFCRIPRFQITSTLIYLFNFTIAIAITYKQSNIMAYDVVVIGSGPGGYVAAIRASQLGLKTAIIEKESLGGICLNWGCIPTKALLKSAQVFHLVQSAEKYGLSTDKAGFDLQKVVKRSRDVAGQLNRGVTGLMKKNKIAVHMGEGKLAGKGRLTVSAE